MLFIFKLLDQHLSTIQRDESLPLPFFTADYLERRIASEPIGGYPNFLRIRAMAAQLHDESNHKLSEAAYLKLLCPLVTYEHSGHRKSIWDTNGWVDEVDTETHVYVAATYTQTRPPIQKWIASGKKPGKVSWLFGFTLRHATIRKDYDLLAAIIRESPHKEDRQERRLQALQYVAEAGYLDATRWVFDFETDQCPWEFSRKRRPRYAFFNETKLAGLHTPSREIFDFLMEKRRIHCIDRKFGVAAYTYFLNHCAREGWTDMGSYCLQLGAQVDGLGPDSVYAGEEHRPLVSACMKGHYDMARVLLQYDADISAPVLETAALCGHLPLVQLLLRYGADHGNAIAKAAAKGYKDIVEALIDDGADTRDCAGSLLVAAVNHEHEAMFALLLQRGIGAADLSMKAKCVKVAKDNGLTSMLGLIETLF